MVFTVWLYLPETVSEMVNFGFKVNDEVVSNRGEKGKIIEICECEECKKEDFMNLLLSGRMEKKQTSQYINFAMVLKISIK